MKTNKIILLIVLSMGMNLSVCAQENMTENPRGVYKLIDFVGQHGKTFEAPEDQYKICTDSITLTLNIKDSKFEFKLHDGNTVLNYTGEEPDEYDAHTARIYDSNAQRFSLKWWSTGFINSPLFSTDDWRTEHYEAGKFSEAGKAIIDAFMPVDYKDEANPLIGVWHPVGTVKNLQDAEELKQVVEASKNKTTSYCILTPSLLLNSVAGKGSITPIRINDKESLQMGTSAHKVTWLSPDTIAITLQTGHTVWARDKREMSLFAEMTAGVPTSKRYQSVAYNTVFKAYVKRVPEALELLEEQPSALTIKYKKLSGQKKVHGLPVPSSMGKNLASQYVGYRYQKDLMDVFETYARQHLSIESLQRLNAMYDTPQARLASRNLKKVKETMGKEVLPNIIKDFKASGGVVSEPIATECPESFQAAFNEFCHATSIEKIMIHKYEDLLESMNQKELKQYKKQLPALSTAIKTNMPILLINACHDKMTEADLKELTSIAKTPEGMDASKMNNEFAKEMETLFTSKDENEATTMMKLKFHGFLESNTHVKVETYVKTVRR